MEILLDALKSGMLTYKVVVEGPDGEGLVEYDSLRDVPNRVRNSHGDGGMIPVLPENVRVRYSRARR